MIKIMIVDDMPIFLEYLRGCIDWEAYGFSICCEARDGKDALEKIPEYYPDVVLTDITMPYEEIGGIYAVKSDGTKTAIIADGRFVLPGTEALNEALR